MNKAIFLLAIGCLFVSLTLVSQVSAIEEGYVDLRKDIYDFVDLYGGSDVELVEDLTFMCENAVMKSSYDEWEVLGHYSYTISWGYYAGYTKSYCKIMKQRSDGGYSYSSLWTLYYKDVGGDRIVKMYGYSPNYPTNTRLKADVPLPL